jgi:hypothetical protein
MDKSVEIVAIFVIVGTAWERRDSEPLVPGPALYPEQGKDQIP